MEIDCASMLKRAVFSTIAGNYFTVSTRCIDNGLKVYANPFIAFFPFMELALR
jgi:hypothetical protein